MSCQLETTSYNAHHSDQVFLGDIGARTTDKNRTKLEVKLTNTEI